MGYGRCSTAEQATNGVSIEVQRRAVEDLDRRLGQPSASDYAALRAQLQEEVDAEKERRAKHEVEIQNLSQLFIAVQ